LFEAFLFEFDTAAPNPQLPPLLGLSSKAERRAALASFFFFFFSFLLRFCSLVFFFPSFETGEASASC